MIIFSRSVLARKTEPNLKLYGETLKVYPQVKFLGITFDSQLTLKKHFDDILDRCNTRYHCLRLRANKSGNLAHPPKSKFINNASDLFLNTALFRPLLPRTISSAKFNSSKTSLFGLPFVYQNTFVLSCFMISSGPPYVKDRGASYASKSLDRSAQNPLVEETISSNRLNPGWDCFPTPLSVVRPVSLA